MRRRVKANSLIGLLLIFYITALATADMLTPDRSFSETENRVLEERPAFSLRTLLSGQFTSDYERYASDQFTLRNFWMSMKTDADRALGKKESNGVFLGRGGYLMERYTSPADVELEERVQAIQIFDRAAPNLRKVIMLVPTAAALLPDKLPAHAPVGNQRADLERLEQMLPQSIGFVDAYSALYAVREQAIFYTTDHHWTTKGAYYGYRELSRHLGIVPQDETSFRIDVATDEFYGSLYSKSGFRRLQPDEIELYLPNQESRIKVSYEEEGRVTSSLYERDRLKEKDKYAVFLDGNHALIRIVTDGPSDKKLLLVKDSFANSLIPFLTKHYGEIDIVDLRYYAHSLLALVEEREFQDMLILYNIKTFFDDPSHSKFNGGNAMMQRGMLMFVLILNIGLLSACSDNARVNEDLTVTELIARMEQAADLSGMQQQNADKLRRLYGISTDDIADFVLYTAKSNVQADELAIIKVKNTSDSANVMEQIEKRLHAQKVKFKGYRPEEYYLIEKHVFKSKGPFVFFAVSKDATRIEQAFDDALK